MLRSYCKSFVTWCLRNILRGILFKFSYIHSNFTLNCITNYIHRDLITSHCLLDCVNKCSFPIINSITIYLKLTYFDYHIIVSSNICRKGPKRHGISREAFKTFLKLWTTFIYAIISVPETKCMLYLLYVIVYFRLDSRLACKVLLKPDRKNDSCY